MTNLQGMDDDLLNDLEDLGEEYVSDNGRDEDMDEADLRDHVTIFKSERLRNLMHSIESNTVRDSTILEATNLSFELEYEILALHRKILDIYSVKFPELEKLVQDPLLLTKTIRAIGNELDIQKVNLDFLPNATVMGIILASTNFKTKLPDEELQRAMDGCDLILDMERTKSVLIQYVASKMNLLAPNLTFLLGSKVAAKLVSLAGSLTGLCSIPACNILVMGAQKKASLGYSSVTMGKHQGVIYECDLIKDVPVNIQRKAARLLSAKASLACRCDLSNDYKDGQMGREFRQDVLKKIDLLVAPPPAKQIKALPLPIEYKKKRGGARARREKERNGASDLQKAQNRMAFGEQEEEIIDATGETVGLGLINGGSGKLKLAKKDFKSNI